MDPSGDSPQIYDITPLVSAQTAVFPGDQPFERQVLLDFKNGDNLVLSSMRTTLHMGAHTDAPSHYAPKGASIEERSLDYYYGPCQVLTVKMPRGQRIKKASLNNMQIHAPRVLFKTLSFPDPNHWNDDFNSLSAEVIEHLNLLGVKLVAIDTPSIDPAKDKTLESHQAVYKNNMAILEGIILDEVPDGLYTLVALPLKLKGCDASPVRAILIDGK